MRAKRSSAARQAAGSRQQAVKTVTTNRRTVIVATSLLPAACCRLFQTVQQRLHLPLGVLVAGPRGGRDAAAEDILRLVIVAEAHERLAQHEIPGNVVRAGGDQVAEMPGGGRV